MVWQVDVKAFGKATTIEVEAETEHAAKYFARQRVKIHKVEPVESGGFLVKFQVGALFLKKKEESATTPATAIDRILAAVVVGEARERPKQKQKDPTLDFILGFFANEKVK